MLEIKKISKTYETDDLKQTALNNVSINFRESEFVSILGPSGSGKTTLLNIIGGLDKYDTGDLIINGVSTKKYSDNDWDSYRNHRVGFVFQSYNLIMHQSVLSNVELALTLSGISKSERIKRAKEVLKKVGLERHINKKPNQLSGGQMQRVAIARALINDPDILLADEPTGALDSKTSEQVMDILKEISKDRLIIMVTHNPDIAEKYSSRIIKLFDGKVIDDTDPFDGKEKQIENEEVKEIKSKKTSMSFKTALSLSLNNLMTKKGRTILTAFAGSIGIIGIALILSLSHGVKSYITSVEEETLSSYPLTIEETTISTEEFMTSIMNRNEKEKHSDGKIHSNDLMVEMMSTMTSNVQKNNLEKFKDYIEDSKIKDYSSDVSYGYNLNLQLYKDSEEVVKVNPNEILNEFGMNNSNMMISTNVFKEMFDNKEINESLYQIVEGRWPEKYNEVVILVDENNEITDFTLYALGLKNASELKEMYNKILKGEEVEVTKTEYEIEELLNLKFKLVLNSDYYKKENGIWINKQEDNSYMKEILNEALSIEVVGIIKPNEEALSSNTTGGVLYTKELTEYVINSINESEIAKEQKENTEINILTGHTFGNGKEFNINDLTYEQKMYLSTLSPGEVKTFVDSYNKQAYSTYESVLVEIGAVDLEKPSIINIYPKDFESKDKIVNLINKYNNDAENSGNDENMIQYTDLVGLMMQGVSTIIDVIGYVLIAFVSISLVVSSIMIGIITYISVLERTKEIGILRAIGARKKDISRVFNAETFIVGLSSGVLGILVTILLNIPINIIIKNIVNISNISKLPILGAIILVLISVLLTIIAGLIPSKVASKKDPVEALRSE
ncbi:MAG: ABC transporter ATP-binding protein/permease [Bacilli bacterium]|nr:ABC transporter ATP-binding protein/permease [Bacilli bacterium]